MGLNVLRQSSGLVWETVREWTLATIARSQTCRECDQRVSALDEVCWNCGIARPAQVPLASCVILFALPVLVLVIYGLVFHGFC